MSPIMIDPGLLKILAVPHHDGIFDWILAVLLCTLLGTANGQLSSGHGTCVLNLGACGDICIVMLSSFFLEPCAYRLQKRLRYFAIIQRQRPTVKGLTV